MAMVWPWTDTDGKPSGATVGGVESYSGGLHGTIPKDCPGKIDESEKGSETGTGWNCHESGGKEREPILDDGGKEREPILDDGGKECEPTLDDGGKEREPILDDGGKECEPILDDGGKECEPTLDDGGKECEPTLDDGGKKCEPILDDGGKECEPILDDGGVKRQPILDDGGVKREPILDDGGVKREPTLDDGGKEREPGFDHGERTAGVCASAVGSRGSHNTSMLGRKKHRRRASKKKRRWKPYYMLSWEEKEQLAERESVRAARLREEMFAKGQPVAPYNTTQFLMEEHDLGEPDLSRAPAGSDSSEEVISGTEGDGAADSGAEDFLKRDFRETYERLHAESLHALSKAELLRDYLELEKSLSWLEEENGKLRRRLESRGKRTCSVEAEPSVARLAGMQAELLKLREENHRLVEENGDLQQLMEQ